MLTVTETPRADLQVLVGTNCRSRAWSGSLARFFDLSRRVIRDVLADIRGGRLVEPAFLFSGRTDSAWGSGLSELAADIGENYDLQLRTPFEDTESIAGALWSGHALFGDAYADALAKLRFSAGTLDLPLHVHEHSDRFIVVLEGEGHFWWSEEPWRRFTGAEIQQTQVRTGDVLVFTRNLLHTFSAPQRDLVLLSYHSPEIPFDDPRQYTLPSVRWTPRTLDCRANGS
jgi:mannose-6-phosphate isomerase-like protein (cupin superfamily)